MFQSNGQLQGDLNGVEKRGLRGGVFRHVGGGLELEERMKYHRGQSALVCRESEVRAVGVSVVLR